MYAAAGGASLASRQARQRQRQNKKQQQLTSQKELKPHKAKEYHNYTDDAAPIAHAQAKLSRVERAALRPAVQTHERRHSASNYHLNLKEPPRGRLRESPSISIPVHHHHHHHPHRPLAASGGELEHHILSSPTLQLPQIPIPEGGLERRCSFVRQVEETEPGGVLDRCNHMCNFEVKEWGDDNEMRLFDYERDVFGSSDYPFSECSQGRAAWQERERGRRCSLSEEARQSRVKQNEAHHRWMKRNRIHDSTYGTGSDDDDFFNVYHQSAAANALLYVGLGTTAIGSVIFFVGTGEKGFKTLELRLIGPTLIACGLLCCLIRVLLCACPSTCLRRHMSTARKKRKTRLAHHHDPSQALLPPPPPPHRPKKKVSIVPPSHQPSTSAALPEIKLPPDEPTAKSEESIVELQHLDLVYDVQSVSTIEDDGEPVTLVETSKLTRARTPSNQPTPNSNNETCLSVVVERSDNSDSSEGNKPAYNKHSGIVLSPLGLNSNQ